MNRRVFGNQSNQITQKSPMEDFLFILVISLAVAVNYFARQQIEERFALAEKSIEVESISMEEYSQLPVVQLRGNENGIVFSDQIFESIEEFGQFLEKRGSAGLKDGVLLQIERSRSVGDLEDTKHLFRGTTVYTEWEKRNE